ncbi:UbiA family prenyltransferase [Poriferisphaera sp. WC338]|uniref:UbiA family prenyltransferase n=1 Tax=Poriferisphaera sp. WC338 TaxID=3425129 RepID=UPI003D814150
MRFGLRQILSLFELGRVELVLAMVGNIWLMTFIKQAELTQPAVLDANLITQLILVTLVALGLAGTGMALNDVLDVRHDRAFAPNRPIPAGRVPIRIAIVAMVLSMICAMAASVWLGKLNTVVTLLAIGGIMFYNLTGRFMPAVGIVSLGLITSLMMLIPDPRPEYGWPVILAMTHVMACSGIRHWLAGKRPRITTKDGFGICMGWLFWTLVIVGILRPHDNQLATQEGYMLRLLSGPVLALIVFGVIAMIMIARVEKSNMQTRRRVGKIFSRLSGLWLIVYSVSWLIGLGLWWQAGFVLGLLVVAILMIWLSRLSMMIRGEQPAYGLSDR